jgi:hypothetical protein
MAEEEADHLSRISRMHPIVTKASVGDPAPWRASRLGIVAVFRLRPQRCYIPEIADRI